MIRIRHVQLLVVASLLVTAGVGGTMPAAAQSDSEGLFEISVTDDGGVVDMIVGSVAGLADRGSISDYITDLLNNEPTPTSQANELQTFVNDHNQSFVTHTNRVLEHHNASVSNGTYVLEVEIVNDERGESTSATLYLVTTADGANITSTRAKSSTTKTVDNSRTISWSTAKQINADLRDYHETYVKPDKIPPESYLAKMATKYGNVSEIEVRQ